MLVLLGRPGRERYSDPRVKRNRGLLQALLALCLLGGLARRDYFTATSGAVAERARAFDAPVDAVWDATLESLRGAGYKVRQEHRTSGTISARRTRVVGRMNEEEATNELKQIYRPEPRVGINVRGMSEYYVALTARIGPSDGKTGLNVVAKITAVFRRRGGRGAPLPVALTSNGFLEQELVQRVQDRLAHGAPQEIPAPP